MIDHCQDTLCCRPEELNRAMAIHTKKITDSCRDKDCIEDLRVYMTRESQNILDSCGTAKVRSAELLCTAIDVSPVAYNRNHYSIDLTFYYRIIADATVNACKPACLCGLAMFSKRAVLCGENTGVHVFASDDRDSCGCSANLPTAVVEVADTNSEEKHFRPISTKNPAFCRRKRDYSHLDFPCYFQSLFDAFGIRICSLSVSHHWARSEPSPIRFRPCQTHHCNEGILHESLVVSYGVLQIFSGLDLSTC